MSAHKLINNFSGGEVTPLIDARIDLQKYETSCRTLENMRPLVHGGATFRASTLFAGIAKYGDKPSRLMPFIYSNTTTYVLELGENYVRFFTGSGLPLAAASASAPPFNPSSGYTAGQYVSDRGKVYICISNTSTPPPPSTNNPPEIDPPHWTAQSPLEVATPYLAADVFQVQFKEINDLLFLVHPSYQARLITRTSPTSFTVTTMPWRYPPLADENLDGVTTMTVGALTGNTTLTCSAAYFTAAMADAYFEVRHLRDAATTSLDISASAGTTTSSALEVEGDWTLTTSERWNGTLQIQRSTDGGSTWKVARQFIGHSDRNVSASGTETAAALGLPRVQLRLSYTSAGNPYGTPPWVGTAPTSYVKAQASLDVADAYIAGLVKCTSYVSATVMNVTVVNKMWATTASDFWSESEFDGARGYPRAIGLYEQRLLFGGTATRPTNVWGSNVADFLNYKYSDLDDGALQYQPAVAQQNPIQWIDDLGQVGVGTSGEEMRLGSGNIDEPLTPSNLTMRRASKIGSEPVQPIGIGKSILYVQRQGKRLREYEERSPYATDTTPDPTDLSLLAEHITALGIKQLAYARLPDAQVYAVLNDGTLGVMAYSKEQNVNAWARYVTDGAFESVAVVPGSPADVVFVVVKRVINSVTVRYIEVFTAEVADKQAGVFGMDSAVVFNQSTQPAAYVGTYLEGKAVAVVADGVAIGDSFTGVGLPVVTAGVIQLGFNANNIRVGLPYFGTLLPQKIDSNLANGTSQGRRKRISEVCVRVKSTLGLRYGNSKTPLGAATLLNYADDAIFRSTSDPMDAAPPLFTGDMILPWNGGNELEGDLLLAQVQPFPMTVLGIFAKYEVFGA